jgi:hypothetical protein
LDLAIKLSSAIVGCATPNGHHFLDNARFFGQRAGLVTHRESPHSPPHPRFSSSTVAADDCGYRSEQMLR